ncbi:MAG: hypothetical protein J7K51_07420 [Thermotogae bacterium]|nr:hypothetical protein [Thermotogota bacterium]
MEIDYERYKVALNKILQKAPIRKDGYVHVSDMWIISSLPKDLLLEMIRKGNVKLSSTAKGIKDKNRVIFRNSRQRD